MKAILVANWKMNPTSVREAKLLFETTRKAAERASNVHVIVCPPAIFLRDLSARYKGKKMSFGVQNAYFEAIGAFTGEISLAQAKDGKASYAIIGHAERRAFGETNDDTRAKVKAALSLKMTPILCVGEKTRSGSGEHFNLIKEQLRTGLADVTVGNLAKVLIAYEPVWAIGASAAMSPRDMHEMAIFIRKTIVESLGEKGRMMKILYGGSIDAQNAADMMHNGDVQGLLVGRASADSEKVAALIKAIN